MARGKFSRQKYRTISPSGEPEGGIKKKNTHTHLNIYIIKNEECYGIKMFEAKISSRLECIACARRSDWAHCIGLSTFRDLSAFHSRQRHQGRWQLEFLSPIIQTDSFHMNKTITFFDRGAKTVDNRKWVNASEIRTTFRKSKRERETS